MDKETLWARLAEATTPAELDVLAADASEVGYGPEGRLCTAIGEKRTALLTPKE